MGNEPKDRRLSLVVASSQNDVIAVNGTIPWHIKEDLKHFKEITGGGVLVMGRKTYWDAVTTYKANHPKCKEDIPDVKKIFPNRDVIVLSTTYANETIGKLTTVNTYENALTQIDDFLAIGKEVFIVGGREIYKLFFNDVYTIHLTKIKANFLTKEDDNVTKFLDERSLMANSFMPYKVDTDTGVDTLNPNWELSLEYQEWRKVKSIITGEIA